MSQPEKKVASKTPTKGATVSQEGKKKRKPFVKNDMYSISKIKQNIKRVIRSNERFTGNVPSLSDQTLVSLATMVIELARRFSETANDCAKKVGKQTIGSDDIFAAVGLELKGELMAHCLGYMKAELAKSSIKKK